MGLPSDSSTTESVLPCPFVDVEIDTAQISSSVVLTKCMFVVLVADTGIPSSYVAVRNGTRLTTGASYSSDLYDYRYIGSPGTKISCSQVTDPVMSQVTFTDVPPGKYEARLYTGTTAQTPIMRVSREVTCPGHKRWKQISATKGCEGGDIHRYGPSGSGYTLKSCKARCEKLEGCKAIDFYGSTGGWCIFLPAVCSSLVTRPDPVSSYEFAPIGFDALKAGGVIELNSCSGLQLSSQHKEWLQSANTLVQVQGCPLSHPWPFTMPLEEITLPAHLPETSVRAGVYNGGCCSEPVHLNIKYSQVHLDSRQYFLCVDALNGVGNEHRTTDCEALCNNRATCQYISKHLDGRCRLFGSCKLSNTTVDGWLTYRKHSNQPMCPHNRAVRCPNPPCMFSSPYLRLEISVMLNELLFDPRANMQQIGHDLENAVRLVAEQEDRFKAAPVVTHLKQVRSQNAPMCSLQLKAALTRSTQALQASFDSRGSHTACCPRENDVIDYHASDIIAHLD